jgi:hypothetical protein
MLKQYYSTFFFKKLNFVTTFTMFTINVNINHVFK